MQSVNEHASGPGIDESLGDDREMLGFRPVLYPFSALVGQDRLCLALLLNAVNPAIGGVLIRGEKGTAKSTAARGLVCLLPPRTEQSLAIVERGSGRAGRMEQPTHASVTRLPLAPATPFVELPLGAGDDQVVGALGIERALHRGEMCFEPGLLARAHGGVLYVDEVNLLPDPIVDLLLDVAASGINQVEREGVSVVHAARFILIGTMNPEEGELRPQLLDRFGLLVDVSATHEPAERAEIVRRRIAFEAGPDGFAQRYAQAETALAARIADARRALPGVEMSEPCIDLIAHICALAGVDGLRADITLYKTSLALAAWEGENSVTVDHIRQAAGLVLPHRRRRQAFDEPGMEQAEIEQMIQSFLNSVRPNASPEATTGNETRDQGSGPAEDD